MRILCDYVSDSSKTNDLRTEKNTVLRPGQMVKLSGGKAVKADIMQTSPVVGICLENHSGTADSMNKRSDGEYVRVACSPTVVYASPAPVIMAYVDMDGGVCDTTMSAALPADSFAGGKLRRIRDGKVFDILSNGAATKTFDIECEVKQGEMFEVFPPVGFVGGSLNTEATAFAVTAYSADFALHVVGYDMIKGEIYLAPAKHEYAANK